MKRRKKIVQVQFDERAKDNIQQIAPPVDENCWYVFANEKEYGPLKLDYLKKLTEDGVLQTNIRVRTSGSAQWLSPEDVPGLFPVMTTSQAAGRTEENSPPSDDRSPVRSYPIEKFVEQTSVPQNRKPPWWDNATIAQYWRDIRALTVPYWLKCLLGNVAVIVVAAAIIGWMDTSSSIRPDVALLAYFLVWILAVAACLSMWIAGRGTAAALQQYLANLLQHNLPKMSWDSGPKVVIAIAVVSSCVGLYQIGALPQLAYRNTSTADQQIGKYVLQGLPDGRALETAAAVGKVVFTDDKIERTLLSNEIYRSVRASAPRVYAQIFQKFKSGMQKGKSAADLNAEISPIVQGVFSEALPYASDHNLLRFTRFFIKEATILKREHPSDCYFIVNPRKANRRLILAIRNRHPELTRQETQIQAQILQHFSGKEMVLPNAINVSLPLERIKSRLRKRKDIDMDLLTNDNIAPDQYDAYCASLIAMYEETLKLPKVEAVSLLRFFFAPR
jgi:GYF domain 2